MTGGRLIADLAAMLFPVHCALCGWAIPRGHFICEVCEEEETPARRILYLPAGDERKSVRCYIPYSYEGKIRKSIQSFKFRERVEYADFYAERIAGMLQTAHENSLFDDVTAVPLSETRLRERGYNQSALVARALANRLNIPYRERLEKTVENRIQHELPREERKKNIRGVYAALDGRTIVGKRILLIDDILTTGSTMGECCSVLYQAGAERVECAAIAYVP